MINTLHFCFSFASLITGPADRILSFLRYFRKCYLSNEVGKPEKKNTDYVIVRAWRIQCIEAPKCGGFAILLRSIAHSIICTRLFRGKMHSDWFNEIEILQGRWQHGEKVGYCCHSGLEKTLCKWEIYVPLVTKGLTFKNRASYI
jgi:hypothetical protein